MMNVDFTKFKGNMTNKGMNSFIDFNNKLAEVNGVLIGDYYTNADKTTFEVDGIEINVAPNTFKNQMYQKILDFKASVASNNDKFIKFVDKTNGGTLIAKIETFDSATIEIDMGKYPRFFESRNVFIEYCKNEGIKILSPYLGVAEKISVDFGCGHGTQIAIPNNIKNRDARCGTCGSIKAGQASQNLQRAKREQASVEIEEVEMLPLGITEDENSTLEAMEMALELLDKQRTVLLNQIIILRNKAKY